MTTIRFHLDENVNSDVAAGLRRRNVDVTTTVEAALLTSSDEEQLEYARQNGRVIVTHDQDFLRLAAAGEPHAGIVYSKKDTRNTGQMIRFLLLLHGTTTAEEVQDHIEFL